MDLSGPLRGTEGAWKGEGRSKGKGKGREGKTLAPMRKMQTQRPFAITDSNLIADGRLY